ncbi:hypothetical protein [Bradyrhizobium sp. F1.13.3]|uniref:hypothetical protein n=1 Tax=Bradyrhizobium sp. F1.13.3 TaxID=3156351 RepID=UPI0033996433
MNAQNDYRKDITDPLIRLFFDKYRMNLLKLPRADLEPGQAIVQSNDGFFGPASLGLVVPSVTLPHVSPPEALADIGEAFSDARDTKAQIGFFEGIFTKFLPGASLGKVSANVEAQGGRKLSIRFASAKRRSIDLAALAKSIAGKPADLAAFDAPEILRIFCVTDIYACNDLEVLWTDDRGHAVGAEIALKELAKLEANHQTKNGVNGSIVVKGPETLAFGFRAVELVRSQNDAGLRVRLEYTYIDVLGSTSDERDYLLLGDPWSGSAFLDLRTYKT